MRVRDLDESELISLLTAVLPTGERTILGSGDDCAFVASPEAGFLVTTDILVGGEHFRTDWSSPDEIGARAAAQNLADVAAMGGRTSSLVVSLVLPPDTPVDWVVALAAGFGERARLAGAGVVGGDLSSGGEVVVSVTAQGWTHETPVLRSGARPGDILAIAGTLGRSGAGLELLSRGLVDPACHDAEVLGDLAEAVTTYRAPIPPLEAGPTAAAHDVHAMMDVSDGLVMDAGRMVRASGVIAELDPALLAPDVRALEAPARACGRPALDWVLFGGEDHPMLAAFPPRVVLPTPFRAIGVIGAVEPEGLPRVRLDGTDISGGWDHFRR
ncbi:thiamine-phosphate kinase [Actinomyces sp.]|uniref:thiamine-phosphate kinase n=1 Tax=Actinomyces sp. TaxID=29317 RepID=UPI00289E5430|nr:thiamine-phosphate kinase [Actinomyces sp.]